MSVKEYRLVGSHSEDLNDGRVIGVGETFKSDDSDEILKRLVDEGLAVPSADQIKKDQAAAKKKKEGAQ